MIYKRIAVLLSLVMLCMLVYDNPAQAQVRRKRKQAGPKTSVYDIDTLKYPIPMQRSYIHTKIDKEQTKADFSDGVQDNTIYFSDDSMQSAILTKALLKDINHMQVMIENMPANGRDAATDNQARIRFLTAVWELLVKFNKDLKVDPIYYKKLVTNMHDMIIATNENQLMKFVKANVNVYTLDNSKTIFEDHQDARAYIYTEMGRQEPQMMIKRLAEYANDTFASGIIAAAARIVPGEVFTYASSTNYPMRNAVRRSPDPLVQTIVLIADKSKSPLKALPFLGDVYTKRKTISEIDAITENRDLYFQNLIRLKLEHNIVGADTYSGELSYRALYYVRTMDDLHESPDAVRFRCIDSMSAEALYYILVYGQDEIYTSSFIGTFKRMMERMKPRSGDQLLDTVHHDYFRTFIRMCAGYNTLSDFLGTMAERQKTQLMQDFIAGLQKGKDDDLEDAVDVADAFGSIKDSTLSAFLRQQVKKNYELSYKDASKKGLYIYSLLSLLFDGSKATSDDAVQRQAKRLGLPSINVVPYKNLLGDTNVVVEQFFFYGDDDGKVSYTSFMNSFKDTKEAKDGKWKVVNDKYWTTISSTIGKPVVIYANLPLTEPEGADEEAQNKLCKYLDSIHVRPTVMVHRGHSYHLPTTMDHLTKQAKIVVLGSCGGYHNLAVVLDHSPDAHIISSKQTGTMAVNEPIIKAINTELLAGNNINWINIWTGLGDYFAKKPDVMEKFSDYVPPYKNLGAIFIKAYRHMVNEDEASDAAE